MSVDRPFPAHVADNLPERGTMNLYEAVVWCEQHGKDDLARMYRAQITLTAAQIADYEARYGVDGADGDVISWTSGALWYGHDTSRTWAVRRGGWWATNAGVGGLSTKQRLWWPELCRLVERNGALAVSRHPNGTPVPGHAEQIAPLPPRHRPRPVIRLGPGGATDAFVYDDNLARHAGQR